jgi:hypothetical protein
MRTRPAVLSNLFQHPTLRGFGVAKQMHAICETYGFDRNDNRNGCRGTHRPAQRINAASIFVANLNRERVTCHLTPLSLWLHHGNTNCERSCLSAGASSALLVRMPRVCPSLESL